MLSESCARNGSGCCDQCAKPHNCICLCTCDDRILRIASRLCSYGYLDRLFRRCSLCIRYEIGNFVFTGLARIYGISDHLDLIAQISVFHIRSAHSAHRIKAISDRDRPIVCFDRRSVVFRCRNRCDFHRQNTFDKMTIRIISVYVRKVVCRFQIGRVKTSRIRLCPCRKSDRFIVPGPAAR